MSERQLGQAFPGNERFDTGLSDIPADIIASAQACYEECEYSDSGEIVASIAKFIAAERERCAKVAESFPTILTETMELPPSQYDIALAIRKGGG